MLRRQTALRSTLTAATLLVAAGTALGAVRTGTDGDDVLVGTNRSDQISGLRGNDTLKGLAGDDLYHFGPNSGHDTLEERPRYKVGDKQLPGGTDTVSFAEVTGSRVQIWLIRQWGPEHNRASRDEEFTVEFGTSAVENAVGTAVGTDQLFGGAEPNRLEPGPGGSHDTLSDYGGWLDSNGDVGLPDLPTSNDTYAGLAAHAGNVFVQDWGGSADVLDLRPLALTDVRVERVDMDNTPGETESLQITKRAGGAVVVLGHSGDYGTYPPMYGQRGRVEKLVFADGTFDAAQAASLTTASAESAPGGRDAELAEVAARLTAEAQAELRKNPPSLPGRSTGETPGHDAVGRGEAAAKPADQPNDSPASNGGGGNGPRDGGKRVGKDAGGHGEGQQGGKGGHGPSDGSKDGERRGR